MSGDQRFGRLALGNPSLDRAKPVDREGPVATRAMIHAGHEEEASERSGCFATAAHALDHLVVIDRGARLLGHVVPALHDEKLATGLIETAEVGIAADERAGESEPLVVLVEIELVRGKPIARRIGEREAEEILREADVVENVRPHQFGSG